MIPSRLDKESIGRPCTPRCGLGHSACQNCVGHRRRLTSGRVLHRRKSEKAYGLWRRSQQAGQGVDRVGVDQTRRGIGPPGMPEGISNMRRLSLLSVVAVLSLVAAPLVTPASAGQTNSAPTYQNAMSNAFAKHGSANALSLNNNAIDQSNLRFGGKLPGFQSNSAPTSQSATSHAFALGGDANATSVNTNEILQ